ncbi:Mbeg1-like protein [Candidatus Omnitrophota bacterium]
MVFNFRCTKFNKSVLSNALILAKLAKLVYETPENVKSELLHTWQANKVYCENFENDMQFALVRFSGGLILVFKGTKEAPDWLVNIDSKKIVGPWGSYVHRGFYKALMENWSKTSSILRKFQSSFQEPLWIAGHSLGGALATLAAAQFNCEKRRVKAMYSFGSPRLGNKLFCDEFNLRIPSVRFVHNEDIVPRVPKFSYEHVGDKCYFDRNKNMILNPSRQETLIDWMEEINFRSLKINRNNLRRHPGGIADHSMDCYISCLENNMSSKGTSQNPYDGFLNSVNR